MSSPQSNVSTSDFGGLRMFRKAEVLAGGLVFVLALPLYLSIAGASWFPPLAGILTAIVGGVVGLMAGRVRLSIKWSVVGLGIVAVGAVEELSQSDIGRGQHLVLATALVASVAAGVLASFIAQLYREAPLRRLFTVSAGTAGDGGSLRITVHNSLVSSNYSGLKNRLDTLPLNQHIIIDLSQARIVDHTALENLRHFQHEYFETGGRVELLGLLEVKSYNPGRSGF